LFNLQSFPGRDFGEPGGLAVEPLPLPEMPARFDLTVYADERPDGALLLDLVANVDLFDRATVASFLEQLGHLLERAAAEPELPLSRISLSPRTAAVLVAPGPLEPAWSFTSVHERFADRARRESDRAAVVDRDGTWTYGYLATRAERVSGRLRQ